MTLAPIGLLLVTWLQGGGEPVKSASADPASIAEANGAIEDGAKDDASSKADKGSDPSKATVAEEDPYRFPTAEELEKAYKAFNASGSDVQRHILEAIEKRVEASDHPELRRLLDLRKRARRELKIVSGEKMTYHEPEVYAPIFHRRAAPESSMKFVQLREGFDRYGKEPGYYGRVRYDFSLNVGVEVRQEPLAHDEALINFFAGYFKDADILVAWLQHKLDHDDTLDAIGEHFDHTYCDLDGNAYDGLSLYDAFSSSIQFDMPDVDVIAYARNVLGDQSYIAPIPPNYRQRELYAKVKDGFLKYFRHRTLVEYVANMMLNPESPISYNHEQLRERILYLLHLDEFDVSKIRNRLIKSGDRSGFLKDIDALSYADDSWRWWGRHVAATINDVRWHIASHVYDVLRENGLLSS